MATKKLTKDEYASHLKEKGFKDEEVQSMILNMEKQGVWAEHKTSDRKAWLCGCCNNSISREIFAEPPTCERCGLKMKKWVFHNGETLSWKPCKHTPKVTQ